MFALILLGFFINFFVNVILSLYRIPFTIRMAVLTVFMLMVCVLAQVLSKWSGSQNLYIAFGMLLSPLSIFLHHTLISLLNRLSLVLKTKD